MGISVIWGHPEQWKRYVSADPDRFGAPATKNLDLEQLHFVYLTARKTSPFRARMDSADTIVSLSLV